MSLPDDLTREILLKLPCSKSAVRLSCVSKSWHSIIKDPKFKDELFNNIKNHLNIGEDDSQMVFIRQKVKISGNPNYEYLLLSKSLDNCQNAMPCPVNVAKVEVVGSCNGILCFGETGPGLAVHLYNPITREHRILPPSPIGAHIRVTDWRGDGRRPPSLSRHRMLGFGFDSSTNDYKVVSIMGAQDVEVYKLSKNSWSRVYVDLGNIFTLPDHTNFCPGALVNGCFHWLPNQENHRILTFDFVSETFGDLLFPTLPYIPFDERKCTCVRLTVLDDSLALCITTGKEAKTQVWVMTEYGNERSWIWKFSVNESCQDLVTGWIHDTNLVMLTYVGSLITCPPMEQRGEEAKGKLSRLDRAGYVRGTVFRPSLVSLHTFWKP